MSSRRFKVAIRDHGSKSNAIVNAIVNGGHEFVRNGPADALLIDFDPPYPPHQPLIEHFAQTGAKLFMYPHSAGSPDLSYDGLWDPDPRFAANFVMAAGQAEFLRRMEYPAPVHVIGYCYGEMRPFRAATDVRHVVFAPIHPVGQGFLVTPYKEANAQVFEMLIKGPWRLTVRHVGTLEANGLRPVDGVTFVNAHTSPQTAEMDVADVVVAGNGSFPSIAIARGVPTVLYCQGSAALGLVGEEMAPVERPELYMDYLRYPFDAFDGPLDEIVHAAARDEAPIATWKRRFIGEPFRPPAFVELFERLMYRGEAPVHIDPTRSFTTLAFVDELLERPELLSSYASRFGPRDDATLILWAAGLGAPELLELAERAIEAAGLADHEVPDVLLTPLPGSPEAYRALAERADAVLSDWPAVGPIGQVPRFDAGQTNTETSARA